MTSPLHLLSMVQLRSGNVTCTLSQDVDSPEFPFIAELWWMTLFVGEVYIRWFEVLHLIVMNSYKSYESMHIKTINNNHSAFSTPSWELHYITQSAMWSKRDSTHPPCCLFAQVSLFHSCEGTHLPRSGWTSPEYSSWFHSWLHSRAHLSHWVFVFLGAFTIWL